MCPSPERATPPLALASRADGGRNGPCRVHAQRQKTARAGGRGTRCTARPRSGSASPQGFRPPCLGEPRGPLDSPVPQKVEQLVAVLARFDFPVPEQVIEVPKIVCPPRAARTVLPAPQTVEQLVEAPTLVSLSCASSSRPLTFQFRIVALMKVFKVYPRTEFNCVGGADH